MRAISWVPCAVAIALLVAPTARAEEPAADPFPTERDRSIALGFLLDTPRPPEVVERTLIVSEKLRVKYGIDTGDPVVDREQAARKAQVEFLDRLEFDAGEINKMAKSLGYSLEPGRCANYCGNVRELAEIELKRLALERFVDDEPWPGRLRGEAEEGEVADTDPETFSGSSTEEDPED